RSFEAETICMALVIFCVALVAAMRLRRSLRLGMDLTTEDRRRRTEYQRPRSNPAPSVLRPPFSVVRLRKGLRVALDGALELAGGRIVEIARRADRFEHVGVARAQRGQQPVLERPYAMHRDRIEVAVDARVDDDDLLFHLERRKLRLFEQLGEP